MKKIKVFLIIVTMTLSIMLTSNNSKAYANNIANNPNEGEIDTSNPQVSPQETSENQNTSPLLRSLVARTQLEAVNWAKAQIGNKIDYDGAYGAQCVDLTKAYSAFFGTSVFLGNARDYATFTVPFGWTRYTASQTTPMPGDICIWLDSGYGHVGIVIANNTTIEQNVTAPYDGTSPVKQLTRNNFQITGKTLYGVLRPTYSGTTISGLPIQYGNIGDLPVIGDWNGDGRDEVGVYRPSNSTFVLRNGTADIVIQYGNSGDKPVIGDWNGDGKDDVGVYRPNIATFVLRNGTTDVPIQYGNVGDQPVIGDWNGDRKDDVGVYRPSNSTFVLRNGTTDVPIQYGNSGDQSIIGDWNGDGKDEVGIYRSNISTFVLRNGTTDVLIQYGNVGDQPVIGDWNGDGKDEVGIYRTSTATFTLCY